MAVMTLVQSLPLSAQEFLERIRDRERGRLASSRALRGNCAAGGLGQREREGSWWKGFFLQIGYRPREASAESNWKVSRVVAVALKDGSENDVVVVVVLVRSMNRRRRGEVLTLQIRRAVTTP